MARGTFNTSVKTRISEDAKKKLEAIAARKELGVADVIREAIRDYINRGSKVVRA